MAEKISQDIQKNLFTKLSNAPVQKSPQGFNYKPLTLEGKEYKWGGGVLYDASWQKVADIPESNDSVGLLNQFSKALGYTGDVIGTQKALDESTQGAASGLSYANPNQQFGEVIKPMTKGEEESIIKAGWQTTTAPVKQATPQELGATGFKPPSIQPTVQPKVEVEAGKLLKPSDLAQGTTLKESDLARTTGPNIYKRDLAKEQQSLGQFLALYGKKPTTDNDWRIFHEYVYEGKEPAGKAASALAPYLPTDKKIDIGAATELGEKLVPTAEEIKNIFSTPTSNVPNINTLTALSGSQISNALLTMNNNLQKIAEDDRKAAQAVLDSDIASLKVLITTDSSQKKLDSIMKTVKMVEKQNKLTSVMTDIANVKSSLTAGLMIEEGRIAPMSILGRRMAKLQQQGEAQIAALTSIASVYQNDMNMAKEMAGMYMDAFKADLGAKMGIYEKLIDLGDKKVVSLKADEKDALKTQMALLQNEQTKMEKNKDDVMEMILKYPAAAQAGKVTLLDTKEEAIAKITPYLGKDEELKTVFETAGGQNWMITYDTQGNITKKVSLGGAYKGTGTGGGTGATVKYKFTNDDVGKMIASGLTTADVSAIQKDLNTSGNYNKDGLTEAQIEVIDKLVSSQKTTGTEKPGESKTIETQIYNAAKQGKDKGLSRSDTKKLLVAKLEKTFGAGLSGEIEAFIEDALLDSFGKTFWQKITPGGR